MSTNETAGLPTFIRASDAILSSARTIENFATAFGLDLNFRRNFRPPLDISVNFVVTDCVRAAYTLLRQIRVLRRNGALLTNRRSRAGIFGLEGKVCIAPILHRYFISELPAPT